jgi:hypothetical protein
VKARRIAALAGVAWLGAALFGACREAIRHGFRAREKPWAVEAFVARRLRRLAIGSEASRL